MSFCGSPFLFISSPDLTWSKSCTAMNKKPLRFSCRRSEKQMTPTTTTTSAKALICIGDVLLAVISFFFEKKTPRCAVLFDCVPCFELSFFSLLLLVPMHTEARTHPPPHSRTNEKNNEKGNRVTGAHLSWWTKKNNKIIININMSGMSKRRKLDISTLDLDKLDPQGLLLFPFPVKPTLFTHAQLPFFFFSLNAHTHTQFKTLRYILLRHTPMQSSLAHSNTRPLFKFVLFQIRINSSLLNILCKSVNLNMLVGYPPPFSLSSLCFSLPRHVVKTATVT